MIFHINRMIGEKFKARKKEKEKKEPKNSLDSMIDEYDVCNVSRTCDFNLVTDVFDVETFHRSL